MRIIYNNDMRMNEMMVSEVLSVIFLILRRMVIHIRLAELQAGLSLATIENHSALPFSTPHLLPNGLGAPY